MTVYNNRFLRQEDLIPREKLESLAITVIGVGAIGRQVAIQLAAIGVRHIQLIDHDIVEETNITTQGYLGYDLGRQKVEATAKYLQQIDPSIDVRLKDGRFRARMDIGDVVFCCVDSITTRAAVWNTLKGQFAFWCDGRMLGELIRVLTATDEASRLHYCDSLFGQRDAHTGSCTSRSTIYTSNIAAGLMLHQFSRWLRNVPLDLDLSLNLLASELTV